MFFRRSNTQPVKRQMTGTHTNKGQNRVSNTNLSTRREPGLVHPSSHSSPHSSSHQQSEPPMSITPPLNPNHTPSTTGNAPVSPLAAAQARRNPNGPAPANFGRQEQQRKLIVGRDITLNGEIATCDHLVVEGTVTATVKDGQTIEILERGSFSGQVEIEQADIAGKFDGELTVRNKLVIRATATVTGTIRYGSLQVDHGAVINSSMTTLPKQSAPAESDSTITPLHTAALNMGNNTSMQQNSYLSSVLDQPGFLKSSGQ